MELNRGNVPDHGRTIGNGVVIGLAVVTAAITALAITGHVGGMPALASFVGLWSLLFGGDLFIQRLDMEQAQNAQQAQQTPADAGRDESPADHQERDETVDREQPRPVEA